MNNSLKNDNTQMSNINLTENYDVDTNIKPFLLEQPSSKKFRKFIYNSIQKTETYDEINARIEKEKTINVPPGTEFTDMTTYIRAVYQKHMSESIKEQEMLNIIKPKGYKQDLIKQDVLNLYNDNLIMPLPSPSPLSTLIFIPTEITEDTTTNKYTVQYTPSNGLLRYKELQILASALTHAKGIESFHVIQDKKSNNALKIKIDDLDMICKEMVMLLGKNTQDNSITTINNQPLYNSDSNILDKQTIDDNYAEQSVKAFETYINSTTITVSENDYKGKEYTHIEEPGNTISYKFVFGDSYENIEKKYNTISATELKTDEDLMFYTKSNNNNDKFNSNRFSIADQIKILKALEVVEEQKFLHEALNKKGNDYIKGTADKFNMTVEEYKNFERDCGSLFRAGMMYKIKDTPLESEETILKKAFTYINNTYSSSKIFSREKPLIENILEAYLPPKPAKPTDAYDFTKSYITDFKVFYLFANYDKTNEALGKLKCKNQYDLLENTLNFIEAIYQ